MSKWFVIQSRISSDIDSMLQIRKFFNIIRGPRLYTPPKRHTDFSDFPNSILAFTSPITEDQLNEFLEVNPMLERKLDEIPVSFFNGNDVALHEFKKLMGKVVIDISIEEINNESTLGSN